MCVRIAKIDIPLIDNLEYDNDDSPLLLSFDVQKVQNIKKKNY
jgi:hypothetical protein